MAEESVQTNESSTALGEEEQHKEEREDKVQEPEEEKEKEKDERTILHFLDSLDTYLLLMDSLSSNLRQGWLDLAIARHSMGPSRISSKLFDHKVQSAATTLQVAESTGKLVSESNPCFTLSKWGLQDEKYPSEEAGDLQEKSTQSKLRHRGPASISEGSHENATSKGSPTATDSHVRRRRAKSLSVFGALVSPKLRTAQASFETALDLIVEIANSRSCMLSNFSHVELKTEDQGDV